ncbi:MAG TPA: hypothetical protein VKH45_10175, partial [Candidatus Acidoferrum sp.]|nr:hypothetical protein [Candidatus Acidoferrum sp.]
IRECCWVRLVWWLGSAVFCFTDTLLGISTARVPADGQNLSFGTVVFKHAKEARVFTSISLFSNLVGALASVSRTNDCDRQALSTEASA